MSWQLATFAGLALVIVGGFWWYERSRPSARLVALVAALAALAVAGRLVLAPIPNLVATTDIVLLTGYALGAGPGFAVGALAAPISNIWLGQGPWTAWQMAGWGLVGLAGAWLASVSGRRLGRFGLAAACGLAGFAYGALLDLSVMVTYGGEQSLDRYLALSARGLPFNVVHAGGNFLIALAAGPALVRMISRFRTRLEFSWRPAGALPLVLAALATAAAVATAPHPAGARESAAGWLARAQGPDGGFAATPGQPSSPAMTGWAMLGLEAAGTNPLDVVRGGESAVDYLRGEAGRLRSVGDLERTILALTGAGLEAAASRSRPGRRSAPAPRPRWLGRRPGQPDRLLRARAARRRGRAGLAEAIGGVVAKGAERRRRLGDPARRAERVGLDRGGAAGPDRCRGPGRSDRRRRLAGCDRRSGAGAAGRSARAASSTRSRPRGRSRAWSRPAPAPARSTRRSATSPACGPPTAITATRRAATRHRSGSPPRCCWRSSASRSRSRPPPGRPGVRPPARAAAGGDSGGGAPSAAGDPGSSPAPGVGSADAGGAAAGGGGGSAGGGGGAAADAAAGPGAAPGVTASADAAEATGSDGAASSAADPGVESADGTAPPVSVAYPDEGSDGTTGPLIAGVAALAAIAGGAALWYRRRGG